MKTTRSALILMLLFVCVFYPETAIAGPGGIIAKGFIKTWWGKLILIVLFIVLMPLIIYVKMREYLVARKNKKLLLKLAEIDSMFSWLTLRNQVTTTVKRVHLAWSNENLEEAESFMSPWYWQNQQRVYLDDWKSKNLHNVCKLSRVTSIEPILMEISEEENFEGTIIAFSVSVFMEDYLENRETKKVVQGKKGFSEEERVWIMEYSEGKWLLNNIEDGSMSLAIAKMPNRIPENIRIEMEKFKSSPTGLKES